MSKTRDKVAGLSPEQKREMLRRLAEQAAGRAAQPAVKADLAGRHEPFPLTSLQTAYLVGRSVDGVTCHTYMELDSQRIDLDRLAHAFNELVARHDMLRARMLPSGDQHVLPTQVFELPVDDLRDRSPADAEAAALTTRERMSRQVLPLESGPPFEIRATRLPDGQTRVHVDFDMTFFDAASCLLLFDEWSRLYADPDLALAPLGFTFRDAVLAEAELQGRDPAYQRAVAYWSERALKLPPGPDLPISNRVGETLPLRRTHRLTPATWAALKARAREQGLTPSAMICAAYADAIGTFCQHPSFTLNLTLFRRPPIHPDINRVVGELTSTILLECDRSAPTFLGRAARLQAQLAVDLDHVAVSGVEVLRDVRRRGGELALPVVFTSLLGHSAHVLHPDHLERWLGRQVHGVSQTPNVSIDHLLYEEGDGLCLTWDVLESAFPPGLVSDMLDVYVRLLDGLARGEVWDEPRRRFTPPAQRARRAEVNRTDAPHPTQRLHQLFEDQAARRPDACAVITPDGSATYAELLGRARRVAGRLRALGVAPGSLVGVRMDKGVDQVAALLGVGMAGAAYVPIDTRLPTQRAAQILALAEVSALLVGSTTAPRTDGDGDGEDLGADLVRIVVDELSDEDLLAGEATGSPLDLAYVIFTSGSTGVPKGVMIDHRGAVNTVLDINDRFAVGPTDRVLAISAPGFDLSVYDVFGALAAGGAIVVPAPGLDPTRWLADVEQHQVTLWNSVPALMEMLVEESGTRPLPGSLRLVMLSGDWIGLDLPARIHALAPAAALVSLGGATEASIWSIIRPIVDVDPTWTSVPYGFPMRNQRWEALDEAGEPCPDWVQGDLYIDGIGVAQGYLRDPERTAHSFSTSPAGERRYRTGDRGRYRADGELEIMGREDHQVKIRGHRIELGEIEAVLASHPDVSAALVHAHGDPRGARRLVAYVVPQRASVAEDVKAAASERWATLVDTSAGDVPLAPPDIVERFELDSLARTYSARALRELGAFADGAAPARLDEIMTRTGILPRYRAWLGRCLAALVGDGLVARDGDQFRRVAAFPEPRASAALQASGFFADALAFVERAGRSLAAALTGEVQAASFLFPEGAADEAVNLYERWFEPCNRLAARLARRFVETTPGPLSILEVGAGVGSTTAYVLPALPADRTKYVYTDISEYFLEQARQRFGAVSGLQLGLLDVERDPTAQGYDLHGFDLIVASSVLHATRSISETLRNVRALLRPHGLLMLIEETQFHDSFNLTMGLQQGFDRFTDVELRRDHPLLSASAWVSALRDAGFGEVAVFEQPGTTCEAMGFQVLMAQGPASAGPDTLALRHFVASRLPEYMVPGPIVTLERLPLSDNGKIDRKALPDPTGTGRAATRVHVPLADATEQAIAAVWADVLKRPEVGAEDNFFDLGGDSLLLVRVRARLVAQLGRDIPTVDLFHHPTVRALAKHLGRAAATETSGSAGRASAFREAARRMREQSGQRSSGEPEQ